MKTLDNYNVEEKNILLRVDLNVPVLDGKIVDTSRIKIVKETINRLIKKKNKIFLISHFGRPEGIKNSQYSLKFLCSILESEFKLNQIYFAENFDDILIKNKLNLMNAGEICLFENVRFYPEEENNDLGFIQNICKNFDVYINDAFSVSHRNHASIVGPPKFLPSFAGFGLLEEIKNINLFINNPKKPNIAIIGGSKISTKIRLLNTLSEMTDKIIIGGAMANTFLHALNFNIGNSMYEKNLSSIALSIIEKAKINNCEVILPVDVVCAETISSHKKIDNYDIKNIPSNLMVLDIGIKTIEIIKKIILESKMILWNGPLGVFEYPPFNKSSIEIANIINLSAKKFNISVLAGGGDTVSAIKSVNAEKGFDYISNAGGAFLEWLEGNESPGVKVLKENKYN